MHIYWPEKIALASRGPSKQLWRLIQNTNKLLRDGHVIGTRCSTDTEVFGVCAQGLGYPTTSKTFDQLSSTWIIGAHPPKSIDIREIQREAFLVSKASAQKLTNTSQDYIWASMRRTHRCSASIKMPESLAEKCTHNMQLCGKRNTLRCGCLL